MSEKYPRFEADRAAEAASTQAWGEQHPTIDNSAEHIASTEPVVRAEYPHTEADEQFNKQIPGQEIPVSDENTETQAVEVVIGTPNGVPADSGELPAPVPGEPKTPELV